LDEARESTQPSAKEAENLTFSVAEIGHRIACPNLDQEESRDRLDELT
jgi:hypothetical protein